MMNKEEIYDSQIDPLMVQIIDICKEHKIAMICTFSIPTPEDDGLMCTSALTTKEYCPPKEHIRALELIYPETAKQNMIKIDERDENGKVVRTTLVAAI